VRALLPSGLRSSKAVGDFLASLRQVMQKR
jgi:hypothetical protein